MKTKNNKKRDTAAHKLASVSPKLGKISDGFMGRFKKLEKRDYLKLAAIAGIIVVPLIIAFYAKNL